MTGLTGLKICVSVHVSTTLKRCRASSHVLELTGVSQKAIFHTIVSHGTDVSTRTDSSLCKFSTSIVGFGHIIICYIL